MATVQRIWLVLGVFLLSFGVLVFEIALTRIFSVIQTYHFVFLIISISMLGLSLGGIFDFFWHRHKASRGDTDTPIVLWAIGGSITIVLFVVLITSSMIANSLLLSMLLAGIPFFFAGTALASVFRQFATHSAFIYAADLIGAALGALGVIWALNTLNGPDVILFAASIAGGGGVLIGIGEGSRRHTLAAAVVLVLLGVGFGLNISQPWLGSVPVGRNLEKDLYRILQNPSVEAEIVESRWSAFGRTDMLKLKSEPDMLNLFVDGAAGTAMLKWNGSLSDTSRTIQMLKHHFTGALPLNLLEEYQKDKVLIIGPGGGRDVLVSLLFGVKDITAVEVNPDFVEIVKKYADFNGGIYTHHPHVNIVVDEGRNFLKRSKEQYDLILLTLPITKSSRSYEGFALTENFLFTKEAFQDYLAHLTPEGSLIIVNHGYVESLKLLTTALTAFADQGIDVPEAMKHIYVLGHEMMPVFGLQKTALDSSWADALHVSLHMAGFDGGSSYVPYAEQIVVQKTIWEDMQTELRMMNQNMIDLSKGKIELDTLIEAAPIDLKSVTDDRPFFFNIAPRLPEVLNGLFWFSGLFLAGVIGFSMRHQNAQIHLEVLWRPVVLFVGIGMGFMLLEIALFQKLVLYLGQPTVTLALLLFSLLVGTGLGSFASGWVRDDQLMLAIGCTAVGVGLHAFAAMALTDMIFDRLLMNTTLTMVVASALLMIIGLAMGFPFPLGIRYLKRINCETQIPWMWGLNGAASVFGSVFAIVLAVTYGYSTSLLVGGMTYLGVSGVFITAR